MKIFVTIALLSFSFAVFSQESFKTDQQRYKRVRTAYTEKYAAIESLLKENNIDLSDFSIYLRSFKKEEELELWAKSGDDTTYRLLKTYEICSSSGEIGPKRQEGDLQVPEGFYKIEIFNPYSNFYLSMGLNYPNRSDRILGVKGSLGGDIYIHGSCVTIGCIPITDEQIKELYVICVEAKRVGQNNIPVTIFPARLTKTNYEQLVKDYANEEDNLGLWSDLKQAYDLFNRNRQLPSISFLSNGRHSVR